MQQYTAVILAAGKGTRMNEGLASPIPKVMFELNNEPIIRHSVRNVQETGIERVVLVVGYKKEMVQDYFGSEVEYAVQEEQLGTGHAVMMARQLLENNAESMLVFYGDCPLYKPETIKKLIEFYENPPAGGKPAIAMLTTISDDPTGYGRVFRDQNGDVTEIIEHKDCNEEQLKNKEWNPGFYIFSNNWFWQNIDKLSNKNAQGEYYLTDMIALAKEQGKRIIAMPVSEENEALGINNPAQLKEAEEVLRNRK